MNKKKLISIIVVVLLVISATVGIVLYCLNRDNTDELLSGVESIKTHAKSKISGINWSGYEQQTVEVKDSLNITKSGIYIISGKISDGMITVNATDSNVKLVLNNVSITNKKGPAIFVIDARHVEIEAMENSVNELVDGDEYEGFNEEDGIDAAIFSKDDLIISGTGTINIKANYNDGIATKDNLKIAGGIINIDSKGDAIKGKESVEVADGKITINSSEDGIKATKTKKNKKGFIYITGGEFNINSSNDAFQAENDIFIAGGVFNITTGGGHEKASSVGNWGMFGKEDNSASSKSFKSEKNVIILGGIFNIDSCDDSFNAKEYLGIADGKFVINSGDDALKADKQIIIDGGDIDVQSSVEGLESENIIINNGNIKLVTSDDGINITGGMEDDMGKPGDREKEESTTKVNNKLIINNGNIYVNAKGDGIDSNGSIIITGGNITVEGPTDDGNGPLDYNRELNISGGSLIALGSSGMAQTASESSTQNTVMVYFTSTKKSENEIILTDSKSIEITRVTPSKNYECVVISSDKLVTGESYTVTAGNESYSFTVEGVSTVAGKSPMMAHRPDGKPGNRRESRR